jgi:tetratricopeptide (TPR) repeat protein
MKHKNMEAKMKNWIKIGFSVKIATIICFPLFLIVSMALFNCRICRADTVDNTKIVSLIEEAKNLEQNKNIENFESAIKIYEEALKLDPNNLETLWRISQDYAEIITIKTSALIVEKDENKPLLKEYGQKAEKYGKKAYEINPKDKDVVASYLQGYGYYASSLGIAQAVLKGAAGRYKDLATQLVALDDKYMDALGYRLLGKMYYMAPWPVGSWKKAKENYDKAIEINPQRLDSHYWMGMLYFQKKQYDQAKKEFEFVAGTGPSEREKYFIAEYKIQAGKHIDEINQAQNKKR